MVYLHEGEDDGETVYMVTIPVKKRPQPSDDIPTPEEPVEESNGMVVDPIIREVE